MISKHSFFKKVLLLSLSMLVTNCNAINNIFAGGFPEKLPEGKKPMPKPKRYGFPKEGAYKAPIPEAYSDFLVKENKPGSKPLFQFRRGDMELTLGGSSKFENQFAKNVVMLNSNIPDEYGYFKQTLDFTTDVIYGERKFGHKAVQTFVDLRQKNMWGNTGKYGGNSNSKVKLDGIDPYVGSHSHKNLRAFTWLKDAWMQFSLNAVFNQELDTLHFLKLGFFPFQLGRGIALGSIYGSSKEYLGIYTGYQNDQSAPGILLNGELLKDRLSYNVYYAKLEELTSGLSETFNHEKAHLVGRSQTPYKGVAKDNDLLAINAKWSILKKGNSSGQLDLEPYVFYNDASDRKIERDFNSDAKSELGTAGLGAEYKRNNFECGIETAINFGQLNIKAIDRNIITLERQSADGVIREVYTKVIDDSGDRVPVTNDIKTIVVASKSNPVNGLGLGTASSLNLTNASDRFRPSYENKYGGWMFVTDFAYRFDSSDFQLGFAYGFASGDENPNGSGREFDKTYQGFVGLQEGYAGKRAPSVLVLDARKIKRPLTFTNNTRKDRFALDDQSFTDMHYIGLGGKWYPLEHDEKKFFLQSNILGYFKDKTSFAYDRTNSQVSTTDKADKFLGAEWNVRVKSRMLKDLYVFADFALFIPGGYYDDVRGTPLGSDIFSKLDKPDQTGVDQADYRLGNDAAFYLNLGASYKF